MDPHHARVRGHGGVGARALGERVERDGQRAAVAMWPGDPDERQVGRTGGTGCVGRGSTRAREGQ